MLERIEFIRLPEYREVQKECKDNSKSDMTSNRLLLLVVDETEKQPLPKLEEAA